MVEAQLVDNRFLEFIGVKDAVIRKQLKTVTLPRTNSSLYSQSMDIELSPSKDFDVLNYDQVELTANSYEVTDDNETEIVYSVRLSHKQGSIMIKVRWSDVKVVLKENGVEFKKGPESGKATRVIAGIQKILELPSGVWQQFLAEK